MGRASLDRNTIPQAARKGGLPVPLRRHHRTEKWKTVTLTRLDGERLQQLVMVFLISVYLMLFG